MMQWHQPVLIIIAVLVGAWLSTKWPAINVIGKVVG